MQVETFAAFEVDDQTIVTVMPYCNGGSLADLLARQGPLPEKECKSIMVQV
jgi:serine/threonine protein kinase